MLAVVAAGAAMLLAACAGAGGASAGPGTTTPGTAGDAEVESAAPSRAEADLVIWSDAEQAGVLTSVAETFGDENDVSVAVQVVPEDRLASFLAANASGTGPDVVLGSHAWIGTLVLNGTIEPVRLTEADQQRYAPLAVDAVDYDGRIYGLPYSYEAVALFRNTALVAAAPSDVQQLAADAVAAGALHPLCLPAGGERNAYFLHPLYSSAGGYLFGTTPHGGYSQTDLGVGREGSLRAAAGLSALGAQGVLETSMTAGEAISRFINGRCAFLVAGPEAVGDVRGSGVPYALAPMVGFPGMEPAQPLVTVHTFFVASKGKGRDHGHRFVLDAANSPQTMQALYEAQPRPPAMTQVLESIRAADPDTAAFADAAGRGEILPAVPQMDLVWEPLGRAEAAIIDGADPVTTMMLAGTAIAEQLG